MFFGRQPKHCAICGRIVRKGTGTYFQGYLIHRMCLGRAKLIWYRYKKKRRR